MEKKENIITIRKRDIGEADKAFAEFMNITEKYMNDFSEKDHSYCKGFKPEDLEKEAVRVLRITCHSTPFREEDIKLVSGHRFPDILASKDYGIEVKSVKGNKWTSTGSSIVESTRIEGVDRIYLLFGCLGTTPAAFKCRLYQECLSEIAVTHSPRYQIDMELAENEDIFSKMGTEYDKFRKLGEDEKIGEVRKFYIKKARVEGKVSFPWWLNTTSPISLSFYSDESKETKEDLICRAFILFPDLLCNNTEGPLKRVALWLCTHYSIINSSLRDMFSAGGRKSIIKKDGEKVPCSAMMWRLFKCSKHIKEMMVNPDDDLIDDIGRYWDLEILHNNLYESWLKVLDRIFRENEKIGSISVKDIFQED